VELDPEFGVGYLVLAVASGNLGKVADQKRYLAEALRHLDGMTERERYTTRGYSYWVAGDYEQCVKEYGDLIALYPADVGGRNQLALCLSNLREMRRAMEEVQEIVKILPGHALFRDNLALYSNYAGDFQTAEETARSVAGPDAYATLALAFAQLGQGKVTEAKTTYEKLSGMRPPGPSFAASGLGDLAAFEGRFSDAVDILRKGAADDLENGLSAAAAAKLAAVAYAELSRGQPPAAIEAAEEALEHSTAVKIRLLAARTFVEAGDTDKARPLIDSLAGELYAEPRAYAKILEGGIALKNDDPRQAMVLLREANDLFDTWIGFFDLGRASLAAGLYPQADGAFDICLNARRGEALSLFVDEEPTYAYLPLAHYYQGRAREEIGTAGFRDSYDRYLKIRGESTEDPLVREVRERIGG
jgi:tetratricopeptide (TPR) repeat protein